MDEMEQKFEGLRVSVAQMTAAQRQMLPFDDIFCFAEGMKISGNKEFKDKQYELAIAYYKRALNAVLAMEPDIGEQARKHIQLSQEVGINLAQAYFKLGRYEETLDFAEAPTKIDGVERLKVKGLYWRAKALYELGRYDESWDEITKASNLHDEYEPNIWRLMNLVVEKIPRRVVMIRQGTMQQ